MQYLRTQPWIHVPLLRTQMGEGRKTKWTESHKSWTDNRLRTCKECH